SPRCVRSVWRYDRRMSSIESMRVPSRSNRKVVSATPEGNFGRPQTTCTTSRPCSRCWWASPPWRWWRVASMSPRPHCSWSAACALGAVVSPPDVAAATSFLRRLPLPRRLVIVLEGESMINDAAAIVAYRMAVAAAVTGSFSLPAASLRFLYVGAGGIVVGLAVGWLLGELRRHIHDPEVENTISLLTGYAAYLPAEHLGVSGILAVV